METTITREVIATEELDGTATGRRRYKFRQTVKYHGTNPAGKPVDDGVSENYAFDPYEVPRALLEDRYEGLMTDEAGVPTKLDLRLDDVLLRIFTGVTRNHAIEDEHERFLLIDGEVVGVSSLIGLSALRAVIRDWILDHSERVSR